MSETSSASQTSITLYTTSWCGDCHALKRFLDSKGLAYLEVNIEEDEAAAELVMRANQGRRSVPTVVAGDLVASLSNFSLSKAHDFLARAGMASA